MDRLPIHPIHHRAHACMHTHVSTWPYHICLWTMKGSHSTQRKFTCTPRERKLPKDHATSNKTSLSANYLECIFQGSKAGASCL